MKIARGNILRHVRNASFMALSCGLFSRVMFSQAAETPVAPSAPNSSRGTLDYAIEQLKQGNAFPVYVEQIARAHALEAVPVLKEKFDQVQDTDTKAIIASALVRLGVKDNAYWSFLVSQARIAISSDVPYPGMFDSQGRRIHKTFSPDLLAWAQAHNVPAATAASEAVYVIPGKLITLADTGDPRGLSLLQQAMRSPNYLVQAFAAKGLAKLQDKASIPLIIEACNKAPAEMAEVIGMALPFFDDPTAQKAAQQYVRGILHDQMNAARLTPGDDPFNY